MLVEKRYEHPYYLKIHFQLEFFTQFLRKNSPRGSYHHPTTPLPPAPSPLAPASNTHTHTHTHTHTNLVPSLAEKG